MNAEHDEAGLDFLGDVKDFRDDVVGGHADDDLGRGTRLCRDEAVELRGGGVDGVCGIAAGGRSWSNDVEEDYAGAELGGELKGEGCTGLMEAGQRHGMKDGGGSAGGQTVSAGSNGADGDFDEIEELAGDGAEDKFFETAAAVGADDEAAGVGVPDDIGDDLGGESVTYGGGAIDSLLANVAGYVFEEEAGVAVHAEGVVVGNGAGFHGHGFRRENGVDEDERGAAGPCLGDGVGEEVVGIRKIRGNNDFAGTGGTGGGIEDRKGHNVPHSVARAGQG
jgi:hypothetical protein